MKKVLLIGVASHIGIPVITALKAKGFDVEFTDKISGIDNIKHDIAIVIDSDQIKEQKRPDINILISRVKEEVILPVVIENHSFAGISNHTRESHESKRNRQYNHSKTLKTYRR